ncbi:MAG: Re/Si-specific NAD(P)(+) transhydrogenase subunit alpha [Marmoricola sp.]
MKIAVARETRAGETRVAMVPDLVGKLTALGCEVVVEHGAGEHAGFDDAAYAEAGAQLSADPLGGADVVVSVRALDRDRVERLREGAATISFLPVGQSHELVGVLRERGITSFAMELVPRISRAQSMDALSSQSLVSGYRCAVVAAGMLRRFFPLNMTAAGTVQPAQVVVLGAGVAGLQAIATAKRLGAVVRAYDVRAAAAEEIRSMGAKAIELDLETLEGSGGYAREMTEDRAARQRELLTPFIAAADALITTAAVPGRQAPLLVTRSMVEQMKPGSVVVDLAAESGGNVEGSQPGTVVRIGNAQVWGGDNVPAQMPEPASRLYAQNVVNILTLMTAAGEKAEDGSVGAASFAPDFDDEIVAGSAVTHAGRITHEATRVAIDGPDPEPEPEPEQAPAPVGEPVAPAAFTDAVDNAAHTGVEDEPDVAEAAVGTAAGAPGHDAVTEPVGPRYDDPDTASLERDDDPLLDIDEPEPDPEPRYLEAQAQASEPHSAADLEHLESMPEPVSTFDTEALEPEPQAAVAADPVGIADPGPVDAEPVNAEPVDGEQADAEPVEPAPVDVEPAAGEDVAPVDVPVVDVPAEDGAAEDVPEPAAPEPVVPERAVAKDDDQPELFDLGDTTDEGGTR